MALTAEGARVCRQSTTTPCLARPRPVRAHRHAHASRVLALEDGSCFRCPVSARRSHLDLGVGTHFKMGWPCAYLRSKHRRYRLLQAVSREAYALAPRQERALHVLATKETKAQQAIRAVGDIKAVRFDCQQPHPRRSAPVAALVRPGRGTPYSIVQPAQPQPDRQPMHSVTLSLLDLLDCQCLYGLGNSLADDQLRSGVVVVVGAQV
jgi:hypothetical protein